MKSHKKAQIALVCMIKDEEKTLSITLKTVKDLCDYFIFLDTGSTDKTLELLKEFEIKEKKKVYIKHSSFINFRDSRNENLQYAEEIRQSLLPENDIHYYLLLDSNDEVKEKTKGSFRKFCNDNLTQEFNGFLCNQQWLSDGNITSYYNTRLIKSNAGWKYHCPVHEYIKTDTNMKLFREDDPAFVIWQDRKDDNLKSAKRYKRDKEILTNEFKVNPQDPRVVFYLAQTLLCLGEIDMGMYFYKLRTTMGNFTEEIYESFKRLGDVTHERIRNFPWEVSMSYYMQAFTTINRAEPLVKIAKYYREKEDFGTSYLFARMACELNYPESCILFVDKLVYDFERWFVLSIVAYYTQQYDIGKIACYKALEAQPDNQQVLNNLKIYLEKEKEKTKGTSKKLLAKNKLKNK